MFKDFQNYKEEGISEKLRSSPFWLSERPTTIFDRNQGHLANWSKHTYIYQTQKKNDRSLFYVVAQKDNPQCNVDQKSQILTEHTLVCYSPF